MQRVVDSNSRENKDFHLSLHLSIQHFCENLNALNYFYNTKCGNDKGSKTKKSFKNL